MAAVQIAAMYRVSCDGELCGFYMKSSAWDIGWVALVMTGGGAPAQLAKHAALWRNHIVLSSWMDGQIEAASIRSLRAASANMTKIRVIVSAK